MLIVMHSLVQQLFIELFYMSGTVLNSVCAEMNNTNPLFSWNFHPGGMGDTNNK